MAQVNGDVPSSAPTSVFFQHLLKYPVINDGVTTFKQNQYGQKSLELSDSAYKTFAQPIIPYFSKPYQYVSPYIQKADSLGDQALSKVDERLPVVKKPTGELYADAKGLILFPYRTGLEGKDHVMKTYSSECKKLGGDNLVTYSKAIVTTVLIVGTETITWAGSVLSAKKAEAKDAVNEKTNN